MRRTIATTLCILSLIFSVGGITCCTVVAGITKKLITESQVVALETSMRAYADSLDSMRDSIDVTGSQIPVYALTLKKTAKLFDDAEGAASELEKLIVMEVPIPGLGSMKPFVGLETVVRDLRAFIPQFAQSLSAAEKSLAGYTPENHEKIIDSIDKTVLLLNTNADKLQEQVQVLRSCIYGFLGICILAGLAHCGLATAILLVLPGQEVREVDRRRRVSFI